MVKCILSFLVITGSLFSQTISFDEFIQTSKDFLNKASLELVKESFDKDCFVTSADIGDISGDGKNDFAISIREKKAKDRIININIYCDSAGNYVKIFSDYLQFFELPIEIAFNISKQVCYVTQKLEDRKWKVTGYTFLKNELKVVDLYSTDVLPITKRWQVGEENYNNFIDLTSFNGYFDLNSIEQFKKSKFYVFPVYNKKRNLYKEYKKEIELSNLWNWQDTIVNKRYGKVTFSNSDDKLSLHLTLLNDLIEKFGKTDKIKISFGIDRGLKRLNDISKTSIKHLSIRNKPDENISNIEIEVLPGNSNRTKFEVKTGKNYSEIFQNDIYVNVEPEPGWNLDVDIPLKYLNLTENQNELGVYLAVQLSIGDEEIHLTSSSGKITDPSSYSRLIFMDDNQFYGYIENAKLEKLINLLRANAIIY